MFSLKNGIIQNSRYKIILKLRSTFFAVKQNDKWGVLSGNAGKLIIPCDYDRLVFEGGHVVLLSNNHLWGAKTILPESHKSYTLAKVDIPICFKEIKILDPAELYFGVKRELEHYDDSISDEYTIVNKIGKICGKLSNINGLDKQCELFNYNFDRILASRKGKYGFISTKGYETIPFIFDIVEKREDGYFDVKIKNAWGVIDISGREIVGIKYSSQLPPIFSNVIVHNVITNRYGVLSQDGSEKIPSIYKHLMIENGLFFFAFNGYKSTSGNPFSNDVNATWGVMDFTGKVIIPPNYDCYKFQDSFLLAGRDGKMLNLGQCHMGYGYDGVYDLYTLTGELIFGGFSEFFYNNENQLYIFFLGGNWIRYSKYFEDFDISDQGYTYKRGNGMWLILDKNLKSIIRDKSGNQIPFKKGTICKIEIKQQDNRKIKVCNLRIDVMARGLYIGDWIFGKSLIIADSNNENSRNYAALNVITGEQTPFYQKVRLIGEGVIAFIEMNKVGIRTYNKIIVDAELLFITNPVNSFYFAAKETDFGYSNLVLRSSTDESFQIEAIKKIETTELIRLLRLGWFLITFEKEEEATLKNIILMSHRQFDNSFVEQVSKKESQYPIKNMFHIEIYWFSNDYLMKNNTYDNYLE